MWIVRLALRRALHICGGRPAVGVAHAVYTAAHADGYFPGHQHPGHQRGLAICRAGCRANSEKRITYTHERVLGVTVSNIRHIESTTYNGISVVKVFLQPGASVDAAMAQITASAQTVLRLMPPRMQPPLIIQYNASSVPILQYSFSSPKNVGAAVV